MKRRTVSAFLCVALVGICLSARASCGGEGYRQSAPPLEIVKDYDLVEELDPCAPFLTEGKGLREKSPFPSRLLLETREHQIAMTHRIVGCLRDCLFILHDAMRSGDYARLRELYRGLHGLRRQMERQTMPDIAVGWAYRLRGEELSGGTSSDLVDGAQDTDIDPHDSPAYLIGGRISPGAPYLFYLRSGDIDLRHKPKKRSAFKKASPRITIEASPGEWTAFLRRRQVSIDLDLQPFDIASTFPRPRMIVEKFTALLSKHGHSPNGSPEPDPGDKYYSPVHDRELVDSDVDLVDGDISGERVAELLLRELRIFAATMEFRDKYGDYAWRVNAIFNVLEARGFFDGVARSKIYDAPIRYVPLPSTLSSVTQREIYDVSSLPETLEELKARMNLNDRTR